MQLIINGAIRTVEDALTLKRLLEDHLGATRGSAAAVDGEVVPRGDWQAYVLSDGQHIELLTAVQGG
ncbi:MAG TPA: sulfur carrier protein ThiS [Jatrophihabitans sp.]|jgi:sulfur carrier protein